MILINLLPHREAARKRQKEAFFVYLGLAAATGLLVSGLIYVWLDVKIVAQQTRNSTLQAEIARLDRQIKEIAGLQGEITALQARQQAVEDLQADRNMPVHLIAELVRQLPEGVYLTSLRQENRGISMSGVAQSNERVSELLRHLANDSPWLKHPELVEIVAANVTLSAKETRRVSNFTIKASLERGSKDGADPAGPAPKK